MCCWYWYCLFLFSLYPLLFLTAESSFSGKGCLPGKRISPTRNSFFWFLGSRNGKGCDCTIETTEAVFAIKLFGVPRRKCILVFTERKEYFTRILIGVLLLIRETFDGKVKQLPEYDFVQAGNAASSDKKLRKILLVNPVPMEMLMQAERGKESKLSPFPMENMQKEDGKEKILSPGDELHGMEITNLSWLLKEL